jgi:hypothetical protein
MRSDIAGTCLDNRDEIDALARLGEDGERKPADRAKAGDLERQVVVPWHQNGDDLGGVTCDL